MFRRLYQWLMRPFTPSPRAAMDGKVWITFEDKLVVMIVQDGPRDAVVHMPPAAAREIGDALHWFADSIEFGKAPKESV